MLLAAKRTRPHVARKLRNSAKELRSEWATPCWREGSRLQHAASWAVLHLAARGSWRRCSESRATGRWRRDALVHATVWRYQREFRVAQPRQALDGVESKDG